MYPFDQYWFGVDISAHAKVVALTNSSLSYEVAVPLHLTFLKNTPQYKWVIMFSCFIQSQQIGERIYNVAGLLAGPMPKKTSSTCLISAELVVISRYKRIMDEATLIELGYGGFPAKYLFPANYFYNVPNGMNLRFVYQVNTVVTQSSPSIQK